MALVKVLLFMISGSIAALTGALLAPRWTYIEPTIAFNVVVFGGNYGSGGGANVFGGQYSVLFVRTRLGFYYRTIPNQTALMLRIAFLLVVYAIPNGIGGQGAKYWAKFKHWRDFHVT